MLQTLCGTVRFTDAAPVVSYQRYIIRSDNADRFFIAGMVGFRSCG